MASKITIRKYAKNKDYYEVVGGGFKPVKTLSKNNAEEIKSARERVLIKRKLRKSLSSTERAKLNLR